MKPAYQSIKRKQPPKAKLLETEDGTRTANVDQMLDILYKAWDKVYNSYPIEERPTWQSFYDRYKKYIDKRRVEWKVGNNNPKKLQAKVMAWKVMAKVMGQNQSRGARCLGNRRTTTTPYTMVEKGCTMARHDGKRREMA